MKKRVEIVPKNSRILTQEPVSTVEPGIALTAETFFLKSPPRSLYASGDTQTAVAAEASKPARKELGETMVVLGEQQTPVHVETLVQPRKHYQWACVFPKGLSSQLRATVASEEVDGGSERVLLLSEELAIEHHDMELECTGWESHPIPYGT